MTTPLGEFLRRERQERGQLLADMAKALSVSSPYLSQIETGKRAIPDWFEDKVTRVLGLSATEANELRRRTALSRGQYSIGLDQDADMQDRELAYNLAVSFARLSPDKKEQIRRIIGDNRDA